MALQASTKAVNCILGYAPRLWPSLLNDHSTTDVVELQDCATETKDAVETKHRALKECPSIQQTNKHWIACCQLL